MLESVYKSDLHEEDCFTTISRKVPVGRWAYGSGGNAYSIQAVGDQTVFTDDSFFGNVLLAKPGIKRWRPSRSTHHRKLCPKPPSGFLAEWWVALNTGGVVWIRQVGETLESVYKGNLKRNDVFTTIARKGKQTRNSRRHQKRTNEKLSSHKEKRITKV